MADFIKGTRHFGIVVRNLETSIAFYQDLGLKITKQMDESGEHIDKMLSLTDVNVTTVKMSAPETDTLIELLHYKTPLPKNIDTHYICSYQRSASFSAHLLSLHMALPRKAPRSWP